jgi:AraC-like DNA-binding protein
MRDRLQLRIALVEPMLAQVRARGGDADALIREFALDRPSIALPEFVRFQEAAAQVAHDPFLGLHASEHWSAGAFGLLELLVRCSPSAREGFARMARYASYFSERTVLSFEESGTHARFEHRTVGVPECLGRHGNELFMGLVVTYAGNVAGSPLKPMQVRFAHPSPGDVSELKRFFGTGNLVFDAGANSIDVPLAWLALRLRTSDPPLLHALEKQSEQILAMAPSAGNPVERAHAIAAQQLQGGHRPSLESVARAMSIGARTLQRRLADENTSFQRLLDSVRERLARQHLGGRVCSVKELALLLGYADASQFTRAFKRWTGLPPSHYHSQ